MAKLRDTLGNMNVRFQWKTGSRTLALTSLDIYAFLGTDGSLGKRAKKNMVARLIGKEVHSSKALWTIKNLEVPSEKDLTPEGEIIRLGMDLDNCKGFDRIVIAAYINANGVTLTDIRGGQIILQDEQANRILEQSPLGNSQYPDARAMVFCELTTANGREWKSTLLQRWAPQTAVGTINGLVDWASRDFAPYDPTIQDNLEDRPVVGTGLVSRPLGRDGKVILPSANMLYGLGGEDKLPIQVAESSDGSAYIFQDKKHKCEWVLKKEDVSDICIVPVKALNDIFENISATTGKLLATGAIAGLALGHIGFALQGIARAMNNYCLIVSYVSGGKNEVLIIYVNPDHAAKLKKWLEGMTLGDIRAIPAPYSETLIEENDPTSYGKGLGWSILLSILNNDSNEGEPVPSTANDQPQTVVVSPPVTSGPVVSEKKYCPNCGTALPKDAAFCTACGQKQPEPM